MDEMRHLTGGTHSTLIPTIVKEMERLRAEYEKCIKVLRAIAEMNRGAPHGTWAVCILEHMRCAASPVTIVEVVNHFKLTDHRPRSCDLYHVIKATMYNLEKKGMIARLMGNKKKWISTS